MSRVQEKNTFADRSDAGYEVGKLLERRYKNGNVLIMGIPSGGVIVACEIANVLNGELSVIITKKLPHPLHNEFAIGAAAEDGSVYLTSSAKGIDHATVRDIVDQQALEIRRRIQRFRKGKPLPDIRNRIVIIADDGIATGSTIVPAIKLCRNRNAAKVIVAVPVAGEHYLPEIDDMADEVVIATQPAEFFSVGQVYEDFHHLSDDEIITALDDFEKRQRNKTQDDAHSR
jgi:putative phosphoribosyl transferase